MLSALQTLPLLIVIHQRLPLQGNVTDVCPPWGFKETSEHVRSHRLPFVFLRQIDMSQ